MNKLKFLTITSISLLVVNLGLICFMLIGKPPHPNHKANPKDIIIKKLELDKQQIMQFESFISEHRKNVRAVNKDIIGLKKQLYQTLSDKQQGIAKDSIVDEIAKLQGKMELIHLAHFKDIKSLCKEAQLNKFEELIEELSKLFAQRKPPPKR